MKMDMPFLLVVRLLIMVQRVSRRVMGNVVLRGTSIPRTLGILAANLRVTTPHAMDLLPTFARMVSPAMVDYPAPTQLSERSIRVVTQSSDAGRRDFKGMWEASSAAVTIMPRLAAFVWPLMVGYVKEIIGSCNTMDIRIADLTQEAAMGMAVETLRRL